MNNYIKQYEEFIINESNHLGGPNSIILIKGINNKLYIAFLKGPVSINKGLKMAHLKNDFYRIIDNGDKLITKLVPANLNYLKQYLGMNSFNIGLNDNKTPFWYNTIKETSIERFLNKYKDSILELNLDLR